MLGNGHIDLVVPAGITTLCLNGHDFILCLWEDRFRTRPDLYFLRARLRCSVMTTEGPRPKMVDGYEPGCMSWYSSMTAAREIIPAANSKQLGFSNTCYYSTLCTSIWTLPKLPTKQWQLPSARQSDATTKHNLKPNINHISNNTTNK